MKTTHLLFKILILLLLTISCAQKNNQQTTEKLLDQLKEDEFDLKGTYFWTFKLMGTDQTSIHTFYEDSIHYEMQGKVHATKYSIRKLSYEKDNQKWIGEDPKRVVYVMFFKDYTNKSITIYKHKCKSGGLEEAIAFEMPSADATDDHGWNIYTLNKGSKEEELKISGDFSNVEHKISINDSIVKIGNKVVEKMSFHAGERRWVGKYKNQYLQLFFKELKNEKSIKLSINWFEDLEKAYRTKHNSIKKWEIYEKK